MREISADLVVETVRALCIEANQTLPADVSRRISACREREPWPSARATLEILGQNAEIARDEQVPLCQDTGMACVFLEVGQDVHIFGMGLREAVDEGVRRGYADGALRKSIVADPLRRANTRDNTPAMLHTDIVPGDRLTVTVAPKGIGSENMSRLVMLPPSAGEAGVKDFVVETVRLAGPNPCPPVVVGVGIGGSFDLVAALAKKALLRPLDSPNPDAFYAGIEAELLGRINALGIGPQGFGGKTTALGVNIEVYPTHIAGLPVAVNINCHVTRRAHAVL
ncbi:MAG: fumarate hydratase [Clostridiales bacterium]|jgi:fumarate hydratase subunit alpha|nr:fumarate hydratase [Clostridiales bacterium]